MNNTNKPFAEILQSTLSSWQAQCWQWNNVPEFGQLVIAHQNNSTVYAIIASITTGPKDPIRTPFAYQKTQQELEEEQPQIFEFLKTEFTCLTLGYTHNNQIYYQLPTRPAQIHTFVHEATTQDYQQFLASSDYLYLLLQTSEGTMPSQELLLALLKQALLNTSMSKEQMHNFLEHYFAHSSAQYQDTKLFLRRIQTLLQTMKHPLYHELQRYQSGV